MKIILRITILCIMIGLVVNIIVAPYSAPSISNFQIEDWLISIGVGLYFLSIFVFWGYLFYHWGVNEFEDRTKKRKWFWVILLGGFLYLIGPLIYYIAVVEIGKGLKEKAPQSST